MTTQSSPNKSPFQLAVSSEMVFRSLPVIERVKRIDDLGFMVEIWDWTKHDIAALAKTGATFSSMTGYVTGTLSDDAGADELLRTAEQSIPIAKELAIPRLNLHGTGLDNRGLPCKPVEVVTGAMWLKARDTLNRLADLGEKSGVTFVLENLNTEVDHPGVPFAKAEDCLALVAAVNRPSMRLMLDLYHAQIGEGNLIDRAGAQGVALYRRNPGRRRAWALRAWNRRNQLPRRCPSPRCCRISRTGRP